MINRTAFQATLDVTVEPIEGSDDWQIKLFEEPNIVATDRQIRELGIAPPQLHAIVVHLTDKELVDPFLEDKRLYNLEDACLEECGHARSLEFLGLGRVLLSGSGSHVLAELTGVLCCAERAMYGVRSSVTQSAANGCAKRCVGGSSHTNLC